MLGKLSGRGPTGLRPFFISPYSPECVEGLFSEVHFHDPAYPPPATPEITLSHTPPRPDPLELVTAVDGYACLWMFRGCKQMFAVGCLPFACSAASQYP